MSQREAPAGVREAPVGVSDKRQRICVLGAGYVGLASAAGLAHLGHDIVCCDLNRDRIAQLNRGQMPLFEPDLSALISEGQKLGRLRFSNDCTSAIGGCNTVLIAVGTPMDGDGRADLSQVFAAADMISDAAPDFLQVLIKSTVAIGSGDRLSRHISRRNKHSNIEVISHPEFLREGSAVEDFLHPDRIVFGVESGANIERLKMLYAALPTSPPTLFATRSSAEMIKYASNSFLAIKVSFINEMADICEGLGADIGDVARGIGLDRRIGEQFLRAGPGFGGSCFPKDMQALLQSAASAGRQSKLVAASIEVNSERIQHMARRISDFCGGGVSGKTIAMLGLTFKADTDDLRASPAMGIGASLLARGAILRLYDPKGMDNAKPALPGATFCKNAYACARGADIVVLATEWAEFRDLDLKKLAEGMTHKRLFDLRNLYTPAEAARAGFDYRCVGRAEANSY